MNSLPLAGAASAVEATLMHQYLTLTLGGEVFALSIEHVREIIEFNGLTEIPLMPDFLRGVINLRGAVVPVLDLALRLGRERTVIGKRTCIVIVEVRREEQLQLIGVLVDEVNDVLDVHASQLQPRPSFGAQIRTDFIASILKSAERFLLVLDLDHVLSLDELAELVGNSALVSV